MRMVTRRDGDHPGADRAAATDISGRVSNDPETRQVDGAVRVAISRRRALVRHVVSLQMVVAKAAEIEIPVEPEMRQLDARPFARISRQ